MAYFPILQKNSTFLFGTHHRQMPKFYMEDFSILGFQVSDCDRAIRILDQHHIPLKRAQDAIEVGIEDPSHMHEIMQLFKDGGLECEIADVAQGMYQG